jgi:hypothetical protein
MSNGYLSGWPEATTPELDRYYHHHHGGSPSARPPHADCKPGGCPFPPYADRQGRPSSNPNRRQDDRRSHGTSRA